MYFIDTNVLSEIRKIKSGKANQGVINWLSEINEQQIYTNIIVMMELERGILAKERKDPWQGKILRQWFEHTIKTGFSNRILHLNDKTAKICATLHIPDHCPENDAWIAASAIQYGLTLVTRNTADFSRMGVKLLNPFDK
ncbi:type II toxin-antitoxin system VapC family toxin [Avibacterium sp. 20-15]|uniref:type II toxin-antitoxin system VapC family toxin n=1 Tax=unclassified Avibacterium TaxID=2685287 RepID=UPI00202641B9|nr:MULTISPECIES: type II toxin-antitoxin system VapC family toxin [unclassified Avibacterium]MCW9732591.1 type II toxin-antitoxin system VapC family toxin [Avibacterium sp. 20-15]URL04743.1 type II toxin-antitoxin system VapC family toxin [Avibacterium sp. 20-132]